MATAAPVQSSGPPAYEDGWLGRAVEIARPSSSYEIAKRALDVFIAVVALTALLPFLVVVATLIKLDSRGPIFFTQPRVTLDVRRRRRGPTRLREFRMVKFRSMQVDADPSLHEAHIRAFVNGNAGVAGSPGSRAKYKLENDPRITRVGRYLRRTSIDELPQLVNVLLGHMSVVGPRPLPLYEVAEYRDEARARFLALPGITGLWQVSGRCDLSFAESVRCDVDYVRNRSLLLDLRILALTLPTVLSGRGAA